MTFPIILVLPQFPRMIIDTSDFIELIYIPYRQARFSQLPAHNDIVLCIRLETLPTTLWCSVEPRKAFARLSERTKSQPPGYVKHGKPGEEKLFRSSTIKVSASAMDRDCSWSNLASPSFEWLQYLFYPLRQR
jgi:hypothetical protein